MAESEEELKSLWMRVREESERVGLKLNIQNTKVMPFSPITAWPIEGEKVEVVTDFLFLGSKITADSDCSHEFKRCFLLGRKAMTILDGILKSRDFHIVKASQSWSRMAVMVFPVIMYGCEIGTPKN